MSLKSVVTAILIASLSITAGAADPVVNPVNKDAADLALEGYDPVAYFTENDAVPGNPAIYLEYNGATYRFINEASRSAFALNPQSYLPAFGGYCAWAVGQGYIADIDPEAWTIHDSRLFLNYSKSIRRRFRADLDGNVLKADENWPEVRSGL